MEAVVSARSDLGAAPPPIVADRLVALHGRLLRLGGSAEQAQRSLKKCEHARRRSGVRTWQQPHSHSVTPTWPAN